MNENPQGMDFFIARQTQKRHLAAIWAEMAGLEPGMVVADIGCGPGVLTREYAAMLGPSGLVYAIERKAEYAGMFTAHGNIRFLLQNYDSKINLERIPHIVFLTDRLQHVADPGTVLRHVFDACGAETRLLITGYDPNQPGRLGTKPHRRIAPEILAAMVVAAGFSHGGVIAAPDEHYALIAKK